MIYVAWALGLLLASGLGIWALGLRLQDVLHSSRTSDLIRLHLRLMPILFGGTVAMRAVFSLDRVFMEWAAGAQALAPYALFAGMGAAFMALVETGAVARLHPPLVMAVSQRDLGRVWQLQRSMLSRITGLIGLMFVTLWLGLDFLLAFVDRPEFSSQSYFAWILGGAYACYALSLPFHLVLYGLALDRLLTGIQVAAAALLCLFGALAVLFEQGTWVSCGVLVSFLYSTAHKAVAARTALAELRRGADGS
jgi:predicted outer membrane lipoprotein